MYRLELTEVKWPETKQLKPRVWLLCVPSSGLFPQCPQLQAWNSDKLHQTESLDDIVTPRPTVASAPFLRKHISNSMLGTSVECGSYSQLYFPANYFGTYLPAPWAELNSWSCPESWLLLHPFHSNARCSHFPKTWCLPFPHPHIPLPCLSPSSTDIQPHPHPLHCPNPKHRLLSSDLNLHWITGRAC